jgi:hypothetical protein
MGADMIGYFLAADKKKAPNILRKAIAVWVKAMPVEIPSPEGEMEGLEQSQTAAILKAAKKLGYHDDMWDGDDLEDSDRATQVVRDVAWLKDGGTRLGGGFRDQAFMEFKVGKRTLYLSFAGEMSWGDEPDGWGYRYTRALERLGVASALWKSASGRK